MNNKPKDHVFVEKKAFDGLLSKLMNTRPTKAAKIKTRGDKSKGTPIIQASQNR
jgi:hypothetical protein